MSPGSTAQKFRTQIETSKKRFSGGKDSKQPRRGVFNDANTAEILQQSAIGTSWLVLGWTGW
jgi:hypothetical protein